MTTLIFIGTLCITRPNKFGQIIRETPKTIEIEITKMDFRPKSSRRFTHKFTQGEREWFTEGQIGRRMKFWKKTGIEIGGDNFIPNHDLILS